jgi:diacylglycerol kinase
MTSSKFLNSFKHALDGAWYVLHTQRNARIHLAVAVVVIVMGLWVGLTGIEWSILALTIAMVLVAEWFNTVTEVTINLVTTEYHPLARIAKDVAAGAVLLAALTAIVVGLLILGLPVYQSILALFR